MNAFESEPSDREEVELSIDIELADIFNELHALESINAEQAMHLCRRAYLKGKLVAAQTIVWAMDEIRDKHGE